jgi:hypothetical protein
MNTNGDLKDKSYEIDVHTIRLILDNIKLYNDNVKLIREVRSLRERIAKLEMAKLECKLCALMREEEDYIVVLLVKNKNHHLN